MLQRMHIAIRPGLDRRNGEAAELNQNTVADEQRDNQAVNRSRRSGGVRGQSLMAAARLPPPFGQSRVRRSAERRSDETRDTGVSGNIGSSFSVRMALCERYTKSRLP